MVLVSGVVVDGRGTPVPNALVNVGTFWTTTRRDGSFELDIPVGSYTVRVVHKDYPEKSRVVNIRSPTKLEIVMGS